MSWDNDLTKKLKDRSDDGHYRDGCYLIGHVLSPHLDGSGPLIISILNGQAMLTEEMVDRICAGLHLREGMTVAVIPGPRALRGGQRFFVLEIPGHGDTAGRDAEDSHPIGAITGLRGELDDHDSRLDQLEDVRVPDLEHDMTEPGGRVPALEGRVEALEALEAALGEDLGDLSDRVDEIVTHGGEPNVIETVKRNGTALPVTGKAVDITVPTAVSQLTNDSGWQNAQQVQAAAQAAARAGLASLLTAEAYGPAAMVSFDGGQGGLPLKGCLAAIQPSQAGSGDPSPANIRAITGWTGAQIHVSPTTTAGDGKTYAVDWTTEAGTVYGGTLDVLKGTLTVTLASVLIGDKSWSYSGGDAVFYSTGFPDKAPGITNLTAEAYKTINVGSVSQMTEASVKGHGTSRTVYIKDTRYSTAAAFRAAMGSSRLVYALAAPITYQLTPQAVTTLAGQNNIRADCGDVTVEYGAFLLAIQQEIEAISGGG